MGGRISQPSVVRLKYDYSGFLGGLGVPLKGVLKRILAVN
jgi:hypothetical protein